MPELSSDWETVAGLGVLNARIATELSKTFWLGGYQMPELPAD